MISDSTIKRPALRYYGGKWNLAPWIISFFPEHRNYVELCGGAASVLLQKPRSPLETYNDLDGNVVNFFQALRDRRNDLLEKILLTPWSRVEYDLSKEPVDDAVEAARRFYVGACMSYNGAFGSENTRTLGWRIQADERIRTAPAFDMANNSLLDIAERFIGVQIECRPYDDVYRRFDTDATLFYFDPPYVNKTRTMNDWYRFDWKDEDHIAAAALLQECKGFVVLSGYACPLYTELYEAHGWERHDKESSTNGGGNRIESVWLSPRTVKALQRPKQSSFL